MAEKRLFHLRKHLNAVHRLSIPRAYSVSSDEAKQITTPEQQTAFLRAADQKSLKEARDALDAVLDNPERITHYIDSIPTKIKLQNSAIPPYTWTAVRDPEQHRSALKRLRASGAHVRAHFTDLMETEYPDPGEDSMREWRDEVARMSDEQKEDTSKSLGMIVDSELQRLKAESQRLGNEVKRLGTGVVEDPWMQSSVAEEVGVKTTGGRKGRRVGSVRKVQVGADGTGGGDAKVTRAGPSQSASHDAHAAHAPTAAPTASLADLQAQLEATAFKNKT